ncbi:MAG: archaeosine biosynthesis radical SAM protein RaSEA [Candidatus Heimdallarchaeota archaeon]|nr:archaeosine biosynthesis radical SAM protein RaSEA [Candidatus Heimdallarchaeota archaeon]
MTTPIKGIFTELICQLRKDALHERKVRDPSKVIAAWIERDHLLEGPGEALVLILNSKGCSWGLGKEGGCSMCGYSNETSEGITSAHLIAQVKTALDEFASKKFQAVKIFNSGSFLDESEIPNDAQLTIIKTINSLTNVSEIIIESRPEFVIDKNLRKLTNILKDKIKLEIGIGLESSNDSIRNDNVNKGFLFSDYLKAVSIAIKNNVRVKTYLLLKPPLLTEKEAINDTIQSAMVAIKAGSRSISINPVNIQNGTFVYNLWQNGLYRSPWFWSLKEVIQTLWDKIAKENLTDKIDRILSDPSGAGTQRGIHNCRKCNNYFIKNLKEYSIHQNPNILDAIECSCYSTWKELLDQEHISRDFTIHKTEQLMNLLE